MYKSVVVALLAFVGLVTAWSVSDRGFKAAPACPEDAAECKLPDCFCSQQNNPLGATPVNIPQIVFLTFDDAITVSNHPFYEEVLYNRKNPNNASIQATFFITHEYNNYSLVNDLWRRGHDIALHSITHQSDTQYWARLNESMWRAEIINQREQMSAFAAVNVADIKGVRAPFLQTSGNDFYRALVGGGFEWDCSRPTWNQRTPGLWPYTNDFLSTQDCQIAPCPDEAFPGFWTFPMLDFIGGNEFPCAMVDECNPVPMTQAATFDLLWRNFNDQYKGNKAPFGVYTHAAYLIGPDDRPEFAARKAGYIQFLDELAKLSDVYIVGISAALEWMKAPVVLAQIGNFAPWKERPIPTPNCLFPRNCYYTNGTWERYMSTCIPCPTTYPWIDNHLGSLVYEEEIVLNFD